MVLIPIPALEQHRFHGPIGTNYYRHWRSRGQGLRGCRGSVYRALEAAATVEATVRSGI
jgi:hypothetical protein